MADFIIDSVNKLREPDKGRLGYGVLQYGSLYIDFNVRQSKEDDSVWASFPSYQKRDGSYRNQVRFGSKEAAQEFSAALNSAWENATVFEGKPKSKDKDEPKREEPKQTTKAPF